MLHSYFILGDTFNCLKKILDHKTQQQNQKSWIFDKKYTKSAKMCKTQYCEMMMKT